MLLKKKKQATTKLHGKRLEARTGTSRTPAHTAHGTQSSAYGSRAESCCEQKRQHRVGPSRPKRSKRMERKDPRRRQGNQTSHKRIDGADEGGATDRKGRPRNNTTMDSPAKRATHVTYTHKIHSSDKIHLKQKHASERKSTTASFLPPPPACPPIVTSVPFRC